MTNVIMPQMGESVTEGVITAWYKKLGDWVDKDESLLSITTDKVDADVPSPGAGYLTTIGFEEGATVEIDTVIAVLSPSPNGSAEISAPASQALEPAKASPAPAAAPVAAASHGDDVDTLRRTRSSPLVRKMAAEQGIDLSSIAGSGVSGRVTKHDFQQHLQHKPVTKPASPTAPRENRWAYQPSPDDRIEPFSPMRASIAEHMVVSRQTSVHVTTVFEVDMTRIAKLRSKHRQAYTEKGAKLSFMPFILKAVTQAINEFPIVNSAVVDKSVAYRRDVNIGMAVAVDWGLLVPVIRQADEKSLLGLSRAVDDLAQRARERKLGPDDLQGGTFTVTNPGIFGSLFGTPIINQPQVAILCVGAITKRPMVTDDDAIAIRHMMYLALSFDHRVIDGATGDRFMKSIKDRLEGFSEELLL